MRPSPLALAAVALPLLAHAQQNSQNNNQPQPSQIVITSTALTTFQTLASDRQPTTVVSSFVFTTTQILTPAPQPSGNGTGNGTASGNNTMSANATTTSNLPTAPASINGGGQNGAPSPGQAGVGGAYGPDDNYIAAAETLKRNAFAVGFVGVALGGALLVI